MTAIDEGVEALRKLGLELVPAELPPVMPSNGVLRCEDSGVTVLAVPYGNRAYAYTLDGADDSTCVLASLAREILLTSIRRASMTDPVREFLNGMGGDIGVRTGKADFYVFAIYCPSRPGEAVEYLRTMAVQSDIVADMGDGLCAFCKKVDDDNDDYRSAGEFALVLRENIAEEIDGGVKIGVGGVARGVSELPDYFSYARSALSGGAEFDPDGNVYSYKEYALIKMLAELPSSTRERYVRTVLDKNYKQVLGDPELISAADFFIKHSLNISEASRSMYVHRNTLIYRLDKIEKMTGLNIRNFNDASVFRIAYLLYKGL